MLAPAPNEQQTIKVPGRLSCLFLPKRYKIAHGGRGGAKSWSFARVLLILGAQKRLRILCLREIQNSIDESVKKLLEDQAEALGLQGFYRSTSKRIIGANGTVFLFFGLNHGVRKLKSMEGIDIVWIEEADQIREGNWDILIPTIRRDPPWGPFGEGSEIWISFNPHLATDATYRMFVLKPPKDSYVVRINYRDNPFFGPTLEKERLDLKERDPDKYLNVYEGHCRSALEGAVYAKELREAKLGVNGVSRITRVPYYPGALVHTFWDLGWADFTAIWFAQKVGLEYRILEYVEAFHTSIASFMKMLDERPYMYGTHYLPHDGGQKHLAAAGRTIKQQIQAFEAKVQIIPVVPKLSLEHEAVRAIFPMCWFDEEKTALGIERLSKYVYEIDEDDGTRDGHPKHDENSHGASAFGKLALSIKDKRKHKSTLDAPRPIVHPEFGDFVPSDTPNLRWMS